jgi:hypothetical protein
MDSFRETNRKVNALYQETLAPLAERCAYELPYTGVEPVTRPAVILLGNHSSGKSAFINMVLGEELQKTGVAPTDDGFTIIMYGEKDDALDGPATVSHPDLTYQHLERFGPSFVSRLKVKVRSNKALQTFTLIDSPGMIDAARTSVDRGYDFVGAVRKFAETSDLVLFFFDPDKPGTTGETMNVFTEALVGFEHKLVIIMNKSDKFHSLRDFARAYGALCWNLARVIPTKDIPHIFMTYIPGHQEQTAAAVRLPLEDFDQSREEVLAEMQRMPSRRADNLVTALLEHARRLDMHLQIGCSIRRALDMERAKWWLCGILLTVLTAILAFLGHRFRPDGLSVPVTVASVGTLLTLAWAGAGYVVLKRLRERLPGSVNNVFQRLFVFGNIKEHKEDVLARWQAVQPRLVQALETLGIEAMPHLHQVRRLRRRLQRIISDEVPALRRKLATDSPEQEEDAGEAETAD